MTYYDSVKPYSFHISLPYWQVSSISVSSYLRQQLYAMVSCWWVLQDRAKLR